MSIKSSLVLYSIEAERAVLGGLLLESTFWGLVSGRLSEESFYIKQHSSIYKVIGKIITESRNVDIVTVSEYLKEDCGDCGFEYVTYLWKLVKETPSTLNIAVYTNVVYEKYMLRSLLHVGSFIINSVYKYNGEALINLFTEIEEKISSITVKINLLSKKEPILAARVLVNTINNLESLLKKDTQSTSLLFGFNTLDKLTAGIHKSDLIIIAGRPTMGKTAFAMNIVENVIRNINSPVVVFSLEMSSEQLMLRLLSSACRIPLQNLRVGNLTQNDWVSIRDTMSYISKKHLYIDDRGLLGPVDIRLKLRRILMEHGDIGLVVIDYLQLMKVNYLGSSNRTNEITEISRFLKMLAREFSIPIIVLSQLNRGLEQRSDKRPMLCDLRDSGAIEQDADLILFIYRDEVYTQSKSNKGVAEVIIGKQRNGPVGSVTLTFSGQYMQFKE